MSRTYKGKFILLISRKGIMKHYCCHRWRIFVDVHASVNTMLVFHEHWYWMKVGFCGGQKTLVVTWPVH